MSCASVLPTPLALAARAPERLQRSQKPRAGASCPVSVRRASVGKQAVPPRQLPGWAFQATAAYFGVPCSCCTSCFITWAMHRVRMRGRITAIVRSTRAHSRTQAALAVATRALKPELPARCAGAEWAPLSALLEVGPPGMARPTLHGPAEEPAQSLVCACVWMRSIRDSTRNLENDENPGFFMDFP